MLINVSRINVFVSFAFYFLNVIFVMIGEIKTNHMHFVFASVFVFMEGTVFKIKIYVLSTCFFVLSTGLFLTTFLSPYIWFNYHALQGNIFIDTSGTMLCFVSIIIFFVTSLFQTLLSCMLVISPGIKPKIVDPTMKEEHDQI